MSVTARLPAIVHHYEIIASDKSRVVPALIAAAGEHASLRFLEFFAAKERSRHGRA